MKNIIVGIALLGLVTIGTGCAGVKAGLATARITVNKVFDVADSSVNTAENTFKSAVGGTKDTVSTATTAP